MIDNPALRIAVRGSEIGTLGLAGAYKSVITAAFAFPSNLSVYQNGITSLMRSMLLRTSGSAVFIE